MGLFGKLGRRTSTPQEWTQLWQVLTPLGGRTTPDAVARWSRWAREQPAETLAAAGGQLVEAYGLLDTEAHGRALAVEPFAGVERPFARQRFLRVLDQVILAGPDAVERVAETPALVRQHDTVHLLDPEQSLAVPSPTYVNLSRLLDEARVLRGSLAPSVDDLTEPRASEVLRAMLNLESSAATSGWSTSRRWPTVRSTKDPAQSRFATEDPEVAWIDVDATELCDEEDESHPDHGRTGCWAEAGRLATLEVFRALGGAAGAQHELAHRQVRVEVVSADDAVGEELHEIDRFPFVLVGLALSERELAVVDPQAQVALLVRRTAERLARTPLPWGAPTREALVALARSGPV